MAAALTPAEMTEKLRSMVLHLDPGDLGLTKERFRYPVFAMMMEEGFEEGSYSLSVVADGSTSLYFSDGGGIIGGGEHETVRKASGQFLSGAQRFFDQTQPVTIFPPPQSGEVTFYFVSFSGVRKYFGAKDDFAGERDPLAGLFFAGHNVIAALRQYEQEKA